MTGDGMTELTPQPPSDASPLTDLSEALRSEDGARVRAALTDRLAGLEGRLSAALQQGVGAADFDRLTRLDAAVKSARIILANFA